MRFRNLILVFILHCFLTSNAFSDDTTNIQNALTQPSSTVTQTDSAKIYLPYEKHGSVNKLFGSSFRTINKADLAYKEYHGFSEMLEEFIPALPYNLGSPGLYNSFSFFGTNPNNISFSFNGRPVMDAEYSKINPEQFNTEYFENIEVLTGSDAVILGDNSSGALINIQEIRYNTKTPYTKLWYSQGGNSYLSADGIYSQNFAPNFNFTFGFRRQTGNGRYENSWVDAWNVRSSIRWTPDEKTNISLVEYFTNHGMGLNGGIDKAISKKDGVTEIFDENYTVPYYSDYNERVFRHDLTLSITREMADDSSSVFSGNIFASNSNWEIENIPFRKMDMTDTTMFGKYISRYYGANFSFEQRIYNTLFLKAGAETYMTDIEKSFYHDSYNATSVSGYALAKIDIFSFLSVSGGARIRNNNNKTILSEGVKLNLKVNESNGLFLDFSLSERMPSFVEGLDLENEKNLLFLAEYSFKNDNIQVKIGTSFRSYENKIFYHNLFNKFLNADGFTGSIFSSYLTYEQKLFRNFKIDLMILNNHEINDNVTSYPPIFAKLSMYYEIEAGRSILRLGVSGKYVTSFNGEAFLPQYRGYMIYEDDNEAMFDGLKVFAVAKLGNAYVKASLENVLGKGFYTVPIYPYYNRNFRLSFMWSFLD